PAGEAPQPLHGLIQRVVRLLPPLPLHRFVLVAELVGLQLEQIGQLFGPRVVAPTAAPAAVASRYLDLAIRRLGPAQGPSRPLLRRGRRPGVLAPEPFCR